MMKRGAKIPTEITAGEVQTPLWVLRSTICPEKTVDGTVQTPLRVLQNVACPDRKDKSAEAKELSWPLTWVCPAETGSEENPVKVAENKEEKTATSCRGGAFSGNSREG